VANKHLNTAVKSVKIIPVLPVAARP